MTLWAQRDGQKIAIHGNLHLDLTLRDGQVQEFAVTEDAGHVKSLWGSLGRLIEEAEAEAAQPPENGPGGF